MFEKIASKWKEWSTRGIHVPFIFDPETNKPSVTLLFPYVTFVITVIFLILTFFYPESLQTTAMSLLFWAISVIFYRLRKLDKVKIDVDDKSIELDSEDESEKENKEN